MGQKSIRSGCARHQPHLGFSRWFADKEYGKLLHEDMKIRKYLMKELKQAGVARIVIERPHKKCRVTIHTARPGVMIGKKGADIEKLRKDDREDDGLAKCTSTSSKSASRKSTRPWSPRVIAQQLERRVAFRRAMKRAVQSAMRLGAEGIRINCSGRLGGAEIARMEWYREGRVPLHTLRADIDYGVADGEDHLRHLRRQGLDLQGRNPRARPDGQDKRATEGDRRGGVSAVAIARDRAIGN
jgi:small subunit ribosomal protein S3